MTTTVIRRFRPSDEDFVTRLWREDFCGPMERSKFTDEQILAIVREGAAGRKVADVCRTHGITEQTY